MTNEAEQNSQNAQNPETKVEKMFEYGYRKSNYGPDELVTDAHGNPISVVDAMLSAEKAATTEPVTPHLLHPNFDNLVESMPNSRIIAFTAHATKLYTEVEYKPTDILLFGPEPGDIPDPMDIMEGPHVAEQVRLPMRPSLRSLNLTNCASIAIYEAWRQLNFAGGR